MKIALAHDSITQLGGAERVVDAFHEIYPNAPLFVLVFDKKLKEYYQEWTIVSSPLQHLYDLVGKLQPLLPFIPFSLRFFDFSEFDVLLSSSSAFAKGIKIPKNVIHINYCHTPARFIWMDADKYLNEEVPGILRPLAKLFLKHFKKWDYVAAQRVNYFIANSQNTKEHIKKYYHRESIVIHPCVDDAYFYPTTAKEDYFLMAGRLQHHKRGDLVIEAFNKSGLPLKVAGTGRALESLKAKANKNIEFLGRVSDDELRDLYSSAKAFIFPQEEDFGIMPLEAMACGTPVIAYGKGGALETVIDGKTGIFFYEQNAGSLLVALDKFNSLNFYAEDLFARSMEFSKETFKVKIKNAVEEYANSR